ncbi:MAG TPA: GlsB/YeaQ/YmgE family stress response membrane protein [Longimicrobiales bacterium]|nr:GlsB/YeaQ/YmgE family stress response membrane protein [Longimicrobiales bacterium]
MDFLTWLLVGLVAGLLASFVMGGIGYGIIGDIIVGMVGAVLGGWLFARLGWTAPLGGLAGVIFVAFIGAVLLLFVLGLVRRGRRGRGILALAAATALPGAPACDVVDRVRDRIGTGDTLSVQASGSGLMLGLHAPGMLRAGEEGVLRLSVSNRTDTTVADIGLELIVPGWAQPMPPRVGDREVAMAALTDGGTRFSYRMEETPIEPGQTQSVEQRIRVPAVGTGGEPNVRWTRVVRARLLNADGDPLAEVEGEIALDPAVSPDSARQPMEDASPRDRIGPVRLGMTVAALRQAVPSARDTTWSQEGMPERGAWVPLANGGRTLAVLSGDSVLRLEVREPAFRTQEGLGVGSSLEELRSAYGAACAGVGEGTVVVWFASAPGISFALDTPIPENVARLRANPDGLPGTARVTRWWLRRGIDTCPR